MVSLGVPPPVAQLVEETVATHEPISAVFVTVTVPSRRLRAPPPTGVEPSEAVGGVVMLTAASAGRTGRPSESAATASAPAATTASARPRGEGAPRGLAGLLPVRTLLQLPSGPNGGPRPGKSGC